jgi:hypothetical protein
MLAIVPWIKIIVMLRNPVERAFSQYQMCVDPEGTPEQLKVRGASAYCKMTFDEAVRLEIKSLTDAGVTPHCDFATFQAGALVNCPMDHGGHSVVARGLYVLQLRQWAQAIPSNQLLVQSINDIKGGRHEVQGTMDKVFSFLGLPPMDVEDLAPKNVRPHGQKMSEETKSLLEGFYRPYNQELFKFLGRELQW